MNEKISLHHLLDWHYGQNGDAVLNTMLSGGADVHSAAGDLAETPLHVAVRRRRLRAAEILLDHGADINARTKGGKTGYAHAIRRGFDEVAEMLRKRGAETQLTEADELAVAMVSGRLEDAAEMLAANPGLARTSNPEEDRLLADLAGRRPTRPVAMLIKMHADLGAPALDGGAALHQAAWFGQPQNARLLIESGAPLEGFDNDHRSSPLGWAVHGAKYSGGAEARLAEYLDIVAQLLAAGASLYYPGDNSDAYYQRLLTDAPDQVAVLLRGAFGGG